MCFKSIIKHIFLVLVLLITAPYLMVSIAQSQDNNHQQLTTIPEVEQEQEKLLSFMRQLGLKIKDTVAKKQRAVVELEQINRKISQLKSKSLQLDQDMRRQRQQQSVLRLQQKQLEQNKETAIEQVTAILEQQYQFNHRPPVSWLLEGQNRNQWYQLQQYAKYIQKSYSVYLNSMQQTLQEFANSELKINDSIKSLRRLEQQFEKNQVQLNSAQQQKQQLLASLGNEIRGQKQLFNQYQKDQQRLEQLLLELKKQAAAVALKKSMQPFEQHRGKLPWPVKGRVRNSFGDKRKDMGQWQGIVIEAKRSYEVTAVHGGKVVFADWMRGFGLLTIIQHDANYLTLYSLNEKLLKPVNSWVSPGEPVAIVGQVNNARKQLYFEVRYQGKPVDPLLWLRPRQ